MLRRHVLYPSELRARSPTSLTYLFSLAVLANLRQGPSSPAAPDAWHPLTFRAILDFPRQFFDLLGFLHQIQAQHLARIGLVYLVLQFRGQFV